MSNRCKVLNILNGTYLQNPELEDWIFSSYVAAERYLDFVLSMENPGYEITRSQFEIVVISPGLHLMRIITDKASESLSKELDKQMLELMNIYDL